MLDIDNYNQAGNNSVAAGFLLGKVTWGWGNKASTVTNIHKIWIMQNTHYTKYTFHKIQIMHSTSFLFFFFTKNELCKIQIMRYSDRIKMLMQIMQNTHDHASKIQLTQNTNKWHQIQMIRNIDDTKWKLSKIQMTPWKYKLYEIQMTQKCSHIKWGVGGGRRGVLSQNHGQDRHHVIYHHPTSKLDLCEGGSFLTYDLQ